MTDRNAELLARAEHYINCNAAESGADVLIGELADALRRSPPATADGARLRENEIELHIGWIKFYVERMDATNWKDMRLRAERQLESLSAAIATALQGQESDICPYCDADMNDEANCSACGRERVTDESAAPAPAGVREALETAKGCIEDLGSGKGGWAWEEVLQQIDAASAALPASARVEGWQEATETWAYIERLLRDECGLRLDEGLQGQRANCINAIKNGLPNQALIDAAIEFLRTGEGLHRIRVNGEMMDRKAIADALAHTRPNCTPTENIEGGK